MMSENDNPLVPSGKRIGAWFLILSAALFLSCLGVPLAVWAIWACVSSRNYRNYHSCLLLTAISLSIATIGVIDAVLGGDFFRLLIFSVITIPSFALILLLAPRSTRRAFMLSSYVGRCPNCLYQIKHHTNRCPECGGAVVSPRISNRE